MKSGLSELVFILDRSGSMTGLEQDTIGGYNALLGKQKNEPGEAIITTVLFDDQYEVLHDRIGLNEINPITESEYFVRGTTALLDAIGRTIDKIKNAQKNTAEEERAGNVLFIITTDGMENASQEYRFDRLKAMIEEQKEKHGWEFLFIGANIDAIKTAGKFGIAHDRAATYCHDSKGVEIAYMSMSRAVSKVRCSETLEDDWKYEIEKDKKSRTSKNENLFSRLKNFMNNR